MANIPFTHQTIVNGVTQVSAATMQTVFDAIRKLVDKSYRSGAELDADTVSGYGIGVATSPASQADLNNNKTNGLFRVSSSTTNAPDASTAWLYVQSWDANAVLQIAMPTSGLYYKFRFWNGSAWSSWHSIWNALNDGNGGQPPAPKPRAAADSDIGQWAGKDGTSGNAYALPAGGTWAYLSWYADDSTSAVSVINRGLAAGGTTIQAASPGKTPKALVWRIA